MEYFNIANFWRNIRQRVLARFVINVKFPHILFPLFPFNTPINTTQEPEYKYNSTYTKCVHIFSSIPLQLHNLCNSIATTC